MKNWFYFNEKSKKLAIVCSILLLILMIISDFSALKTEKAITEAKDEVFDKIFYPMWESFILPLCVVLIAFIPKSKKWK